MGAEEGFDDDAGDFRPPPPIEDRLWRHPAEVARLAAAAGGRTSPAALSPAPRRDTTLQRRSLRRSPIAVGFVSVVGSAVLAGSLMFTAGGLGDEPQRLGLAPFATLVPPSGEDTGIVSVVAGVDDTARTATALVLDDGVHVITSSQVVADVYDTSTTDASVRAELAASTAAAGSVTDLTISTTTADGADASGADALDAPLRIIDERGVARTASVVALDPANDLAILRVHGVRLSPFDPNGAHAPAEAGELALYGGGYGAGLRRWRVAIAEHDVAYHGDHVDHVGVDVLADDVPAAAAGAVAVDDEGRVVGLVSVDLRRTGTGGATRLPAVIVPASRVRHTVDQFLATGTVTHAWLGVEATPELDTTVQVTRRSGAAVDHVVPGSPAGAAGVRAGDIITRICDDRIGSIDDLVARLLEVAPGTPCSVELLRDGGVIEAELVLGGRAA